jgi:paraquat-inducible protein B
VSARASSAAIGAFVLGAIVLLATAIVLFGGGLFGDGRDRRAATVIFTGSVRGLSVGAPVTLRGVQIGEVTGIDVLWEPNSRQFVIPVTLSIAGRDLGIPAGGADAFPESLIDRGLRAQLKTQSLLTGLLYIDLDFLPDSEARFVDVPTGSPQIPSAPTDLEEMLQRVSDIDVQSLVQHANETLASLNELLADPQTRELPANLNALIGDLRVLSGTSEERIRTLGVRADGLLAASEAAVGGASRDLAGARERLNGTLDRLDGTRRSVEAAAGELGFAVSEESPLVYRLTGAIAELARAGRSLQALADTLEREPEAVLRGKSARREE